MTDFVTAGLYLFVPFTYFALHLFLLPRATTRLLSCNCESVSALLYLFVSCFLQSTYNFHTSENRVSWVFFFHFSSFHIVENSWYHWQIPFFTCSFFFSVITNYHIVGKCLYSIKNVFTLLFMSIFSKSSTQIFILVSREKMQLYFIIWIHQEFIFREKN